MEKIIFELLIISGASCWSAKHVFISDKLPWYLARQYCKEHHNDLSCLATEQEENLFRRSVGEDKEGWIGIYWDKNVKRWKWSDGDTVTYHNNLDLPDNNNAPYQHTAENVYWTKDGWEWKDGMDQCSFFCLNPTMVQEEKTWEEALEYCRKNHTDFTSLLSETENLLITNEINRRGITEQVWIGLRYLGDSWLWVNGDPLKYEAWSQGEDHQCPMKRRCGALTKQGVWTSLDCEEKLHFICD